MGELWTMISDWGAELWAIISQRGECIWTWLGSKNVVQRIDAIVKIVGLIVGTIWFLVFFIRRREPYPLIEFTADLLERGVDEKNRACEVVLMIKNVGKARHQVRDLGFQLRAIAGNEMKISTKPEHLGQIAFENKIIPKGSGFQPILPPTNKKGWKFVFVDPGVTQKFSFVILIPVQHALVWMKARFFYRHIIPVPWHRPPDHEFQTLIDLRPKKRD